MSLQSLPIYCLVGLVCVGCIRSQPEPEYCESNNGGCDTNAYCSDNYNPNVCTCPRRSRTSVYHAGNYFCHTDSPSPCYGRASSGLTCMCRRGYTAQAHLPNGMACIRDDCAINNGGCDVNAKCVHTHNGPSCTCKFPYRGDGNECEHGGWSPGPKYVR